MFPSGLLDPIGLRRKDVAWLDQAHVLGHNSEVERAFISGTGSYDDYGAFDIRTPGNDPNDPQDRQYPCYTIWETDGRASFPFHRACMHVLAKCLGLEQQEDIDIDALHAVCSQNSRDGDRTLSLNYGNIDGPDQCWQSYSGEEYVASDPSPRPRLREYLRDILPKRFPADETSSLNLEHKVQKDPLRALPYDILYIILEELPLEDIRSLMQSSWYVFSSTRNNAFWKQKLASLILPWFWEASFLLDDESFTNSLNWKDVFLWLEKVTRPQFGISGPFMGIANRRRIWEACQPLIGQYAEKVHPEERPEPEESEANAILDSAKSLHTAIVTYPVPETLHPVSSQFIRSWSEIKHRSSVLDTYWNSKNALIGVSITFSGTDERVFGSTEGRRGDQLYIPEGEWIREITIHTRDIDMFNRGQDRSHIQNASENVPKDSIYISGLTVSCEVWYIMHEAHTK